MVYLLERRIRVQAPLEKVWAHLEHVEQWPSWARHLKRVEVHPSGALGLASEATLHLTSGRRTTLRVEELHPGGNWKWAGRFLWLAMHCDHRFRRMGPRESEVRFLLQAEGIGAALVGRLAAVIYARHLDRAITNLVKELEGA